MELANSDNEGKSTIRLLPARAAGRAQEVKRTTMATTSPLLSPHRGRVRRVVLLCSAFSHNVAYYHAGLADEARPLMNERHRHASFWRQVNGNFYDMAVLDWCKLFGGSNEKHHWRRVVSDAVAFESALLAHLAINTDGLKALVTKMLAYRDQYIAHLDNGSRIHLPELESARKAVTLYHRYVVECEARPGELIGLPDVDAFMRGFDQCAREAAQIYQLYGTKKPFFKFLIVIRCWNLTIAEYFISENQLNYVASTVRDFGRDGEKKGRWPKIGAAWKSRVEERRGVA